MVNFNFNVSKVMDGRTLFPGEEKAKSAEKIQVQDQSNSNILTNRLSALNGKIPLDWLNGSLDSFKIKSERLLMENKVTMHHSK